MSHDEPMRPRVLAIDDSDLVHRLLRARLRHERIDLHSVLTADEGIAAAKELQPEVILLDIDLEDLDGFEVLARLKLVSADSTLLVPSIPVQIAGPPTDLDQYLVTIDPAAAFLRDVTLRGPAEAIASIAEGRMSVIAFLHLTSDELAQGITEKAVSMWQLPAGVTVSGIGDDSTSNPMVPLTIEDRTRQP